MFLAVTIFSSFVVGSSLGWVLEKRGVTADNALKRYQRSVYLIGSIALGIGICIGILMANGQRYVAIHWLVLYIVAYSWQAILLLCCFCTGLFLFLEQPGWNDRHCLQQLILFLAVSLSAIPFLLYQSLPVTTQLTLTLNPSP